MTSLEEESIAPPPPKTLRVGKNRDPAGRHSTVSPGRSKPVNQPRIDDTFVALIPLSSQAWVRLNRANFRVESDSHATLNGTRKEERKGGREGGGRQGERKEGQGAVVERRSFSRDRHLLAVTSLHHLGREKRGRPTCLLPRPPLPVRPPSLWPT